MKIMLLFFGATTTTSILPRGHSGLSLEKARERGLLIKTKKVADLLDGVVFTGIEQHFGAGGEEVGNPSFRTDAGVSFDNLREMLR